MIKRSKIADKSNLSSDYSKILHFLDNVKINDIMGIFQFIKKLNVDRLEWHLNYQTKKLMPLNTYISALENTKNENLPQKFDFHL